MRTNKTSLFTIHSNEANRNLQAGLRGRKRYKTDSKKTHGDARFNQDLFGTDSNQDVSVKKQYPKLWAIALIILFLSAGVIYCFNYYGQGIIQLS